MRVWLRVTFESETLGTVSLGWTRNRERNVLGSQSHASNAGDPYAIRV